MTHSPVDYLLNEIRTQVLNEPTLFGRDLDSKIYDALRAVARDQFVPVQQSSFAWLNMPVEIGYGQTISQPLMVALMTELLSVEPGMDIMEVGTGSGYQTAILSYLGAHVTSLEIIPKLHQSAKNRLSRLGYKNIELRLGDGAVGAKDRGPFDRIIITSAPETPPDELLDQLKETGYIIAPIGAAHDRQYLFKGSLKNAEPNWQCLMPVSFVPMVKADSTGLSDG